MKKVTLILGILIVAAVLQSFCGFYVAKADTRLYNKQSEVILVRHENRTTVTMSNDFDGNVKDFAIVVPVPEVLKEENIKVVKPDIFDKLRTYSDPRLVEYYDENPCEPRIEYCMELADSSKDFSSRGYKNKSEEKEYKVQIEAKYTVGEYDILILSAQESSGLQRWLTDNGYKIPEKAEEVLEPYIKNNLKFFVVKVNLDEMKKLGREKLSPIQINYKSDRFMLPIRLGMANAKSTQDMVVYAFTQKGRVEATNYRTTKIPTDKNVPTFIKNDFGQFYSDLFDTQYSKKGKNTVFLEYAWDISSSNYVKCDPCNTTPPTYKELSDAGVFFVDYSTPEGWQGSDYTGDLFFTRLHVRYDREHFPMDLQFQETPNKENFQGRYIMQHPAQGKLDCEMANSYFQDVLDRREEELDNLHQLAGWDVSAYNSYLNEYRNKLGLSSLQSVEMKEKDPKKVMQANVLPLSIGAILLVLFIYLGRFISRKSKA